MIIRNYKTEDYDSVVGLYKDSSLYGGEFDEDRDSKERLQQQSAKKPDSILVAEVEGKIIGTVTLFEDERSAWLFRFAVVGHSRDVMQELYEQASSILKSKGHKQVLLYAPAGEFQFEDRYIDLGFNKGGDYTCYFRNL
jgi:predicted N-acetyltransferase YhbS